MVGFITELIASGGYVGIFALMVLENVFPPIPSEVIMGLGGLLVDQGRMEFWPLVLVGTAGTLAGNWVWYAIGWRFGYRRFQPLVQRWGRWLTLEWRDVIRMQRCFSRHGYWVILVLRFSPVFRTLISLPAGMARMPFVLFSLFTFGGSLVWNAALVSGGKWAGRLLAHSGEVIGWLVAFALIAGLVLYVRRVLVWKPHRPARPREIGPEIGPEIGS